MWRDLQHTHIFKQPKTNLPEAFLKLEDFIVVGIEAVTR